MLSALFASLVMILSDVAFVILAAAAVAAVAAVVAAVAAAVAAAVGVAVAFVTFKMIF